MIPKGTRTSFRCPGLGQETSQWAWKSLSPESKEATNDYWCAILSKEHGIDQLEGAPTDQKLEFLRIIKNKKNNGLKHFKTV